MCVGIVVAVVRAHVSNGPLVGERASFTFEQLTGRLRDLASKAHIDALERCIRSLARRAAFLLSLSL